MAVTKERKRKEYLFNFEGGGWNSEFAFTKKQAKSQAKNKYANDKKCVVNFNSFRVSTPEDYQNLLSLFY